VLLLLFFLLRTLQQFTRVQPRTRHSNFTESEAKHLPLAAAELLRIFKEGNSLSLGCRIIELSVWVTNEGRSDYLGR
jgi:hypothetical protein